MASRDREARRKAALQAAQTLLEEEGVAGLSMRRLARASGMAVNTLYAMFSTRDGILTALVHEAVSRRTAFLREQVGEIASPVARLKAMIRASAQHAVSNPRLMKPMYRASAQLRGLRRDAARVGVGLLSGAMAEAVRAGELREVDSLLHTELLMLVVHEASLAWALDEISDDELVARCQHALAVLLAAAAPPEHAAAAHRWLEVCAAQLVRARSE